MMYSGTESELRQEDEDRRRMMKMVLAVVLSAGVIVGAVFLVKWLKARDDTGTKAAGGGGSSGTGTQAAASSGSGSGGGWVVPVVIVASVLVVALLGGAFLQLRRRRRNDDAMLASIIAARRSSRGAPAAAAARGPTPRRRSRTSSVVGAAVTAVETDVKAVAGGLAEEMKELEAEVKKPIQKDDTGGASAAATGKSAPAKPATALAAVDKTASDRPDYMKINAARFTSEFKKTATLTDRYFQHQWNVLKFKKKVSKLSGELTWTVSPSKKARLRATLKEWRKLITTEAEAGQKLYPEIIKSYKEAVSKKGEDHNDAAALTLAVNRAKQLVR